MAITKKPKSNPPDSTAPEALEDAFITRRRPAPTDDKPTPILLRFKPDLLKRITAAARRAGINRSAWIYYTLNRVLDEEEG